jgi:hypothetical protein
LQFEPTVTIQALLRAEMPVVQHAALFADRKMVGTGLFRPYSILPSGPDWDAVTVVLRLSWRPLSLNSLKKMNL